MSRIFASDLSQIAIIMFTGIVEALGTLKSFSDQGENRTFIFECPFTNELKVDQSLAHNGVCLTVTDIRNNDYSVTAIAETLKRTNLGLLNPGDKVNLERCMIAGGRLDGHIVQGHVDETGTVDSITDENGSWHYRIAYNPESIHYTVPKGSICINGVSLTVVESSKGKFSVAIIPFTFEHTTFHALKPGDKVNLEFDVIGKYVTAYMKNIQP
jgi:riboflavin synthase